MGTIELLHDLWDFGTPSTAWPKWESFAQTSGGVANAVHAFAACAYGSAARAHLQKAFNQRRIERLGAGVLTFKEEFLHISRETAGGLIVVVMGTGTVVKSVDTWEPGQQSPRALSRDEARKLWAKNVRAVVVDPTGTSQLFVYRREDPDSDADAPPPMTLADPLPNRPLESGGAPSAEVLQTRALIKAAREALLPEKWALRPVASAATSCGPSTSGG